MGLAPSRSVLVESFSEVGEQDQALLRAPNEKSLVRVLVVDCLGDSEEPLTAFLGDLPYAALGHFQFLFLLWIFPRPSKVIFDFGFPGFSNFFVAFSGLY